MSTIQTADLFNKDAFSDIKIKFGSRQFKAHKIVICRQSQYFNKLCGPDTQFAEGGQTVIELKEDDEDAVYAMLQWIYTFEYDTTWAAQPRFTPEAFEFHNNVHLVADKYQLPTLSTLAKRRVNAVISSCTTDTLLILMCRASSGGGGCDPIQTMQSFKDRSNTRFKTLLHDDRFLQLLKDDPELSLNTICMLRPA
ncbi:hypothetical protein LTR36_004154 [Oleoguttula mirabilis]|uniref:BTB domain-containing protein n=1 Tax=Oleoguttula mirabilis TaxID=1507867 RepID=A0AAV9JGZ9_9PEZI|nr:hypothetical protein LTR36_004154 [Oleoguttula mirabilis]